MTRRHALLTGVAAIHLVLVICGAVNYRPLSGDRLPAQVLRFTQAVTGSDSGYGFFAPDVGCDLRARFTLIDAAGRRWDQELDLGNTLEERVRIANVLSLAYEDDLRRDLAGSLAGTVLARNPTAEKVIVRIDVYDPPTMDDYSVREKLEWESLYMATISRKQLPSS
jgi:hypothetical protein